MSQPYFYLRPSVALQRALPLAWVLVCLGGLWVGDEMVTTLGVIGIVWTELRASIIAAMRPPPAGAADMEDLTLRVTALEKRVAALKYAPAVPPKVQEDILEVKTIIKSLSKALEESAEHAKGGRND